MKKIVVTMISIVILLTSCQIFPKPIPALRTPLSLSEIEDVSTAYGKLAVGMVNAGNARDYQAIRALFAEDAVMRDRSYGDYVTGKDEIIRLFISVASVGPKWASKFKDYYIAKGEGLSVSDLYNLGLGDQAFTLADPLIEVDRLQMRDSLFTNWTIFYGLDSLEKIKNVAPTERLQQARSVLAAYASAWSTGDPVTVAELYTNEAIREDTLFGEQQEGRKAIQTYAGSFFTWYPGARWTLSLGFGEGQGESPITGGLFSIRVTDLTGKPCEVKAAVLLQSSENQVIHESVFYEPDSLISCGWAR